MKQRSDRPAIQPLPPIPMNVVVSEFGSWKGIRGFFREATDSFLRVDAMGLAKQVAFSVVFALLPTIFLMVSLGALAETVFGIPVTEELRQYVVDEAPTDLQPILLSAIDQAIAETSATAASLSGLLALGLAIWGGAGGVGTLVEATNRAYGVRNIRSFPHKRFQSLLMTLALTGGIVVSVIVSFFGGRAVDEIDQRVDRANWIVSLANGLQVLIPVVGVFLVLILLYHFAPVIDQEWRLDIPGAVVGTVALLLLLRFSGFIAARIEFSSVYGAAGGFMIFLYVLNFAGIILISGAIINGVLGARYDRKRYMDLLENPRKVRYVETNQEVAPDPFALPFGIGQKKSTDQEA